MKVSGTAERHLERSWRHLEGFWNLEWAGTVERVGPWSRVRALEEAKALDGRVENGVLDQKKVFGLRDRSESSHGNFE